MTTIRFFGGDLGDEDMMVRCNLSEASAPVEVDYCTGCGWQCTQYQCSHTSHTDVGLVRIGRMLAANAVEIDETTFTCEWTK